MTDLHVIQNLYPPVFRLKKNNQDVESRFLCLSLTFICTVYLLKITFITNVPYQLPISDYFFYIS